MPVTAILIEGQQGFLGYRLTQGTMWITGGGFNDWSGCYIATTLDQAKGYVEVANGIVRVWSCALVVNYPFWCIHGAEIADPLISSEAKALMVEAAILAASGQQVSSPLIPSLCNAGQGYVGPDAEALEIILGWACLGALTYTAFRDYLVTSYEITAWRDPDQLQWQPMDSEPAAPSSPIPC